MTLYKAEDKARLKREREREAINLAMQSQWQKAIEANQAILELFSTDVEAYNRLGKALMELSHYDEAKEAFSRALELSPSNEIAKRNVSRLAYLTQRRGLGRQNREERQADPRLFIEETGKTGVVDLQDVADARILAGVTPGDVVNLKIQQNHLLVVTQEGEYLGRVEPGMALRLIKLIEGGNKYAAAITSSGDRQAKVIIKETYQHPSQAGRVSFPSRTSMEGLRPYLKEGVPRPFPSPLEEEEFQPELTQGDWEEEEQELAPGEVSLEEVEEEEEEEEF